MVRVRLVTRWLSVISITTIINNIMVPFTDILFGLYTLYFNNFLILFICTS